MSASYVVGHVGVAGYGHQQGPPCETARMRQRAKQVQIGKMTQGYENYITAVPKEHRDPELHLNTPSTSPRSIAGLSKRAFEMVLRQWRQFLHTYDGVSVHTDANDWDVGRAEAAGYEYCVDDTHHPYDDTHPFDAPDRYCDYDTLSEPFPWTYHDYNGMLPWRAHDVYSRPAWYHEEVQDDLMNYAACEQEDVQVPAVPALRLDAVSGYAEDECVAQQETEVVVCAHECEQVPSPPATEGGAEEAAAAVASEQGRPDPAAVNRAYASSGSSGSLSSARSVSTAATEDVHQQVRAAAAVAPHTCPTLRGDDAVALFPSEPELLNPEADDRLQQSQQTSEHSHDADQTQHTDTTYRAHPPASPYNIVPRSLRCRYNSGKSCKDYTVDHAFNNLTQDTPVSNLDALSSALIAFT